ncbi:SDR family NAD(P)-dependent oxidoreductase [Streptomyces sp. NPDC127110]|uniref:SDR family NAD(P)-dependent oxidoreductase n=1 Tax=Streptomyces sp. NPDC127110 TaxID=3345362 RepID=UPI003624E3B4
MFLSHRTCLVTGGGAGIGLALVRAFAAQGARVHACDISADNIAQAERTTSGRVVFDRLDVTDSGAVTDWIDGIGQVDVLVNNAAYIRWLDVTEMSVAEAERTMRTGFESCLYTIKAALPHLGDGAHIVNIGSSAGRVLVPGPSAAYAAMKAAVEAYTVKLRHELAGSGTHVMLVRPGTVAGTQLFGRHVPSERLPRIADFLPPTSPERVAAAVLRGLERRRDTVDVPAYLPLLYRMYGLSPALFRWTATLGGSARRDYSVPKKG